MLFRFWRAFTGFYLFISAGAGLAASPSWAPMHLELPDGSLLVEQMAGGLPFTGWFLTKLDPTGAIDPTFGKQGRVELVREGDFATRPTLVLSPGGGILVLSSTRSGNISRLMGDGTSDRSFGAGGSVTLSIAKGGYFLGAAKVDLFGRILLAGSLQPGQDTSSSKLFLARLRPDGRLDESFGDHGYLVSIGSDKTQWFAGLVFDAWQRIVLLGEGFSGSADHVIIMRVYPNGQLDKWFGDDGVVSLTAPGNTSNRVFHPTDIVIDRGVGLLIAGNLELTHPCGADSAILRLDPSGGVDASYGTEGLARTGDSGYPGRMDAAEVVKRDPFGDTFVANTYLKMYGGADPGARECVFGTNGTSIARFDREGRVDTSFGANGFVTWPIWGGPGSMTISDTITVVGQQIPAGQSVFSTVVLRFDRDGQPDPGFGTNGVLLLPPWKVGKTVVPSLKWADQPKSPLDVYRSIKPADTRS